MDKRWMMPLMEACKQMDQGDILGAREAFRQLKSDMIAAGAEEAAVQQIDNYLEATFVQEEIDRLKQSGGDTEKISALTKKKREILRK